MKRKEKASSEAAELRREAEERVAGAGARAVREGGPDDALRLLQELRVHQVELEMQNEALRASRDDLEVLLEKYLDLYDFAPVGYVTLDPEGAIREANLSAASLLGRPRGELLGRRLGAFLAPGSLSAFADMLANVTAGRRGLTCDVNLRPEGEEEPAYVQLSGEPLGKASGCRIALVDMTDRRRAEDSVLRWSGELLEANEGLRAETIARKAASEAVDLLNEQLNQQVRQVLEANKELDAFSCSVSHDLRSPLRSIDGFAARLQLRCNDVLDEEGKRLLGIVRASTLGMAALIDDLLAFSRAGRGEIRAGLVGMGELARGAFEEAVPDPEARGRIDFECGPLPAAVGDAALLRLVWSNLLGNAVKYSGRRERPAVRVSGESDGCRATYRVSDNGVGFDMAYVGNLFGIFQRLHSAHEFEGTGVGLALVHRIVARHGGDISAFGEVGGGATFTFWLPAAK